MNKISFSDHRYEWLRARTGTLSFPTHPEGISRMISTLFWLIDTVINLYIWVVIIAALFSLLIAFNVLDTRNRAVWTIGDFLYRATEPALRPIRNILPNLGGLDLSPLVLLLLLQAARMLIGKLFEAVILGSLRPLL